ncbi:cell division protein ZapA, partial [Enterobacter quasiroggenkampii]|nr:cell division protein ZapA [Enterobacter quasiroggenkampii]
MTSPDNKHRVAVEIYGTQYKLVGSTSKDYMRNVAAMVDEHMRSIATANSRLDTTRIAVLSAVHIAEQVQKVKDEQLQLSSSLKEIEATNH